MLTIHSLLPLKTVRSVRWLRLSGSLPRACALVLTLAIFFWYLKVQNSLLSSHQIQEKKTFKNHTDTTTLTAPLMPPAMHSLTRGSPHRPACILTNSQKKLKISKNISTIPFYPPTLYFNARCAFFPLSILVERKRKRNPGSPNFSCSCSNCQCHSMVVA